MLSFSTSKHMSLASRTIYSNCFEKQCSQNHPQYLSGLSRAFFPTTFLETSCIRHFHISHNAPYLIPPPPHTQILHKHCLQFLLGRLYYPGEMKNKGFAKFGRGRANKVHYEKCGSGVMGQDLTEHR